MLCVRVFCSPIIGVVVLGEGGSEEECWGHVSGWRGRREHYSQSTKPFHALMEALRAVSTVPPSTTSFCGVVVSKRQGYPSGDVQECR